MKTSLVNLALLAITCGTVLLPPAIGQSVVTSEASPSAPAPAPSATPAQPVLTYLRPTRQLKLRNYLFTAIGPYPIVGAAVVAGINQADSTPPEWGQGAEGYGKRFISNFGIAGVSTTTRYALAEVFREDTMYYRCECKGFFPRLGHALISTVSARRGDDGHRVFSFPSLVSPYAGTMTAVYVWYPGRYDARDGLRMGNYSMLALAGGNVAMEFFFRGPHSLLARLHLNNPNAGPAPSSNP